VLIPFRHGRFDRGEKFYEPKNLRLECATTRALSKAGLREISYCLSGKNALRLWDEPDKHYIGEMFESAEVEVLPGYAGQRFTLSFLCEPFAYGEQKTINLKSGANTVEYRGTAPAPAMLVIRNPNAFAVSEIVITAIKRK
jgi:phage-related protein